MTTVDERLKALQITLPDVQPPVVDGYVASFVQFVRTGNLVHLSGCVARKMASLGAAKGGSNYHTRGQTSRMRHCHRIARHAASRPRGPGQNKTDREADGDVEQHTEFYRVARGCQRRVRTFPRNLWRAWSACAHHVWRGGDSIWGVCGDRPHCRGHRPGRRPERRMMEATRFNNSVVPGFGNIVKFE